MTLNMSKSINCNQMLILNVLSNAAFIVQLVYCCSCLFLLCCLNQSTKLQIIAINQMGGVIFLHIVLLNLTCCLVCLR